jgi:hypothetical protein
MHIEDELDRLRKFERKCFRSRKRFAFHRYLAEVLKLYEDLRADSSKRNVAMAICETVDRKATPCLHPIRALLDATSAADSKTKSRWTRALRFAWKTRRRWKILDQCFRQYDGVAGCASQFAALNPRYGADCVVHRDPAGRVFLVTSVNPVSYRKE